MKKIVFIALLFIPFLASAQGFVPLAPIPGLTDPSSAMSVINSQNLANFFNNLYKYLIGVAAVLAVIEIIWGGLEISTKDSVSKKSDGKARITQAILGLVLVLSPVIVFSIINPSILNLSLNLPKLKTAPGAPVSTQTTTATSTQESVRAGSTRAIYNGQIIGFQEDYYASPQAGGYCFQLKDGVAADGKNYFCTRDSNGCRMIFNELTRQSQTQADRQCTKY